MPSSPPPIRFDHMFERVMAIGLVLVGVLALLAGVLAGVLAIRGSSDFGGIWIFAVLLLVVGVGCLGGAYLAVNRLGRALGR